MKDTDFNILKKYTDGENTIYDVSDTPYSIFNNSDKSKYLLYEDTEYEKYYPSGYVDYDIFRILNCLNAGYKLENILSDIELKSNFNQALIQTTLIEMGFIKEVQSDVKINVKEEIEKLNASELSNLLKKYGIMAAGKKKKLIKLAIRNIPEHEFGSGEFNVTSQGQKFLHDREWINIYGLAFNDFEFIDFYKYLDEHDGDFFTLALDFVDEHFNLARKAEDFHYLDDCYEAKALVYSYEDKDLNKSFDYAMERFIIRLNPVFPSYSEFYAAYLIFHPINIEHIDACSSFKNIREEFDKIWDLQNFKKQYVSKDTAFDYLQRALAGEDVDELSEEFADKYFRTAEEYYNIGMYYFGKDNFNFAADFFDLSLEEKPKQIDALYYLALSLCHIEDSRGAMKVIDEAIELDSSDSRFWNIKGVCAGISDNDEQAADFFEIALKLNPENIDALSNYGIFFVNKGDYDRAFEYFDKAFEADSTNIGPILYKAKLYGELEDWDNAEKCYRLAKEIDGDNEIYYSERAMYYLIRKEFKKALECCDKSLNINGDKVSILMFKSMALSELGDEKGANECLKKVSKIDSLYVPAIGQLYDF